MGKETTVVNKCDLCNEIVPDARLDKMVRINIFKIANLEKDSDREICRECWLVLKPKLQTAISETVAVRASP